MHEHEAHMAMHEREGHEKEEYLNHNMRLAQREESGSEVGVLNIRWLTQRMYGNPKKMCVWSKETSVMDVDCCSVVCGKADLKVIWFELH